MIAGLRSVTTILAARP